MSYSLDFRKQVFKLKEQEKLTFEEAGERFGVPIRTLFRWQQRIEPKTKRNKPSTKIDMEALRKDIEQYPDAYRYERAKTFGVGQSTIHYALKRLGISNKKKRYTILRLMNKLGLAFSLSCYGTSSLITAPLSTWMKVALV